MDLWLYALGSVLLVSLVSLVGVFTLSLNVERLQRIVFLLVSFAVGAMLGGALIHLIPHAFAELGDRTAGLLVLLGVIVFFMLEKFLHWRHDHGVAVAAAEVKVAAALDVEPEPIRPFATMNLVGDAAHNLLDGMVIAAAYLVSIPTGVVTTVAVMLHEIPQEIGDFGVLVYGGFEPKRALLYNFISGLAAVVGAVLSLVIGAQVEGYAAYLLPLTAGSFIYIAGSDLIPELHHHHSYPASKSVWQLVMILLGVGVMLVPALLGFDAR
jgi:zinc and cadmium transporter